MTSDGTIVFKGTNEEGVFQFRGSFPIAHAVLTIHTIYDLPREMHHLDPKRVQLSVVLRPIVKYCYRGHRIISIPLGEYVLPFAPSAILYKGSRFVLDLDTTVAKGLPLQHNTFHRGSLSLNSSDSTHKTEASYNEEEDEGSMMRQVVSGNQIHLQYPRPEGLTTLIDVLLGINQQPMCSRLDSYTFGSLDSQKFAEGVGHFSVNIKDIERKKNVTRVVGLSVGRAICSVSVSPRDGVAQIVQRLKVDQGILAAQCSGAVAEDIKATDVELLLRNGVTEEAIHRRLLLLADKDYYVRRLDALFAMYPSSGRSVWRQISTSALLAEHDGREEQLIQSAIVEFGPECSNVSARYRLIAFCKRYSLNDDNIREFFHKNGVELSGVLDVDTELLFAALTKHYGKEPRPTSYLFHAQSNSSYHRALLYESLQFTMNRIGENYRDVALAPRIKRAPFTMSPYERPLHFPNSPAHSKTIPSEIDVLREKYTPEFAQIIPSIANAIQSVVQYNEKIQCSTADNRLSLFDLPGNQPRITFQDFLHRFAEYTYISPSSLLGAVIYLDRLCTRQSNLLLTQQNVFRLFLTSVRVSSKVIELRSINNNQFSTVFGLDLKSLNSMEEIFLKELQFDLFLTPLEFREYAQLLQPPSLHQIPRSVSARRTLVEAKAANTREENNDCINTVDHNESKNIVYSSDWVQVREGERVIGSSVHSTQPTAVGSSRERKVGPTESAGAPQCLIPGSQDDQQHARRHTAVTAKAAIPQVFRVSNGNDANDIHRVAVRGRI